MTTATSTLEHFAAAFNSGDATRVADCYTTDAIQQHVMLGTSQGRAAILAAESPMFAAFSDVSWTANRIVEAAAGGWHAVEWTVVATNTGPLATPAGEVPATGRTVTLTGASLLQITDDELIAEEHRYFDTMAMLTQLGLT